METWLIWVVAGFVLVIAELMSGTFYLLVVGVGAFAAGIVAWLGGNEIVQALVGSAVAVIGGFFVYRWHHKNEAVDKGRVNFLDRGQAVVLEGWVDEHQRVARVKYRGAWWDARLAKPEERPSPGTTLYIESQEGNTLVVSSVPP
jgi:membrane protein implicated in regulation of membrane protease activity